jgi:hypothetical protein
MAVRNLAEITGPSSAELIAPRSPPVISAPLFICLQVSTNQVFVNRATNLRAVNVM